MNKKFFRFFIVGTVLLILTGIIFYVATSPSVLRIAAQKSLPAFIPTDEIEVGEVIDRGAEGITFNQLELKNLKGFPAGTIVRIQRIMIRLKSLDPREAQIDFENIRVFFPHSDPIVISGNYHDGQLSCNVYSRTVSIEEILSLLPHKFSTHPTGIIKNIDLYLEGPLAGLKAKASFEIEQLILPRFTLLDAPGELTLLLKRKEESYSPTGEITVSRGKVRTKNALMKLQPSKLFFSGSFINPSFDVRGLASVGKINMDIVLLGTPDSPLWKFSSSPPLPEEVLMLMFLTGKGFGTTPDKDFLAQDFGAENSQQQKLTPDVAKDLADFLLFGGEGGRLAEKFGIKDVSLIYDKNVAGIGVTKEVTDYLDVGYQVEQKGLDSTSDLKHTVDAEIKLNPNFSVEVDKELYQVRNEESFHEPLKTDDKILLKYKTQF